MIRTLIALATLLPCAAADILLVSESGAGDFTQIQPAIDASTEADVILVEPGAYAGFDVLGRTARIIGTGGGTRPLIQGLIRIEDLPADRCAVISGLDGANFSFAPSAPSSEEGRGLLIRNCLGAVRVQNCKLRGNSTHSPNYTPREFYGVSVEHSNNVSIVGCLVEGGVGDHGLLARSSNLATAQSSFEGGEGGGCYDGGDGVNLLAGTSLFDASSFMNGGHGATAECLTAYYGYYGYYGYGYVGDGVGTDGGNGASAGGGSSLQLLDSVLMGSHGGLTDEEGFPHGSEGAAFVGIAPIVIDGIARRSSHAATIVEGEALDVSVEGVLGDQVTLALSELPDFENPSSDIGVRLGKLPVAGSHRYREVALGTLVGTSLDASAYFPYEGPEFTNETWFAQVVATDTDGVRWWGPGRTVTVLDAPGFPVAINRCSGDGGDQNGCTDCPCANNSPEGTIGGCINSAATAARLYSVGNPSISLPSDATSDLRFHVTGAPADAFCILFSGDALAPTDSSDACFGQGAGSAPPAFAGLLCASGSVRRYGSRRATAQGGVGVENEPWGGEGRPALGVAQVGPTPNLPGQTHFFQVIYRDATGPYCTKSLNSTQALELAFWP